MHGLEQQTQSARRTSFWKCVKPTGTEMNSPNLTFHPSTVGILRVATYCPALTRHYLLQVLIKAWAFSKKDEAPARAEQIVQQMNNLSEAGEAKVAPNMRTYSALAMCYGFSKLPGSPQHAEAVVKKMDVLYQQGKLAEGPSKQTFEILKRAWETSREPDKKRGIATINEEMRQRFGK